MLEIELLHIIIGAGATVIIGVIAWTAKAQIARIGKLEEAAEQAGKDHAAIKTEIKGIAQNVQILIAHFLPPARTARRLWTRRPPPNHRPPEPPTMDSAEPPAARTE